MKTFLVLVWLTEESYEGKNPADKVYKIRARSMGEAEDKADRKARREIGTPSVVESEMEGTP